MDGPIGSQEAAEKAGSLPMDPELLDTKVRKNGLRPLFRGKKGMRMSRLFLDCKRAAAREFVDKPSQWIYFCNPGRKM